MVPVGSAMMQGCLGNLPVPVSVLMTMGLGHARRVDARRVNARHVEVTRCTEVALGPVNIFGLRFRTVRLLWGKYNGWSVRIVNL
jgi:hypothetical protein